MKQLVLAAMVCVLTFSCSTLKETQEDWRIVTQNPQFIHGAVKQVTDVIVYDIFSPPVASRIYTYMSVAGYEAARHFDPKFQSLAGQLNGLEKTPEPEPGQEY